MSPQLKILQISRTDEMSETKVVFKCTSKLKDVLHCVSVLAGDENIIDLEIYI